MPQRALFREHFLHAFWSSETYRVLFVGLLAWIVSAVALAWTAAYGFLFLPTSALRATALAIGFGVGAVIVVLYGAWRSLNEPRRLAGALGAGALLTLPLLLGILLPAVFSTPGLGFANHSARMLELGILLPLCAHAAFTVARGTELRSRGRVLVPELLLLAMVLGLAALPMHRPAPAALAQPFQVVAAATP